MREDVLNQFPSAISRYLVSNTHNQVRRTPRRNPFPSAISRYLVSNLPTPYAALGLGLVFPSAISRNLISNCGFWCWTVASLPSVSIRYIAVLGFQQGGSFLKGRSRNMFPSAISRYLVSNSSASSSDLVGATTFPSAISRYLVSNLPDSAEAYLQVRFHPLYRGTWFPTLPEKHPL